MRFTASLSTLEGGNELNSKAQVHGFLKAEGQVLFDFCGSRVVEEDVSALVLSQGALNYGPLDVHKLGEGSDVDSLDSLRFLAGVCS